MRTRPLVIGHRGNAGPAPANTLAGYQQAIELGLDMIEVDLQVTRDGAVVMVHDGTVDETTNGEGRVDSFTLDAIRQLDAGSWKSNQYAGERIPTLEETLEIARDRLHLSLDLKDVRAIPHMAQAVRDARMLDQVVVCGCDVARAAMVREVEPRFTVVLNMDSALDDLAKQDYPRFMRTYLDQATEAHLAALNVHFGHVCPPFVREAHLRGLPVWTWTVDDPADIKRLVAMGVDAIYSNWPERVLKVLDGTDTNAR